MTSTETNAYSHKLLENAWRMFANCDANAKREQKSFNLLQILILFLGVLATALALSQTQFSSFFQLGTLQESTISLVILILPITISILITARNQFKYGSKWLTLRASAEAIKGEIYMYRTNSVHYSARLEI